MGKIEKMRCVNERKLQPWKRGKNLLGEFFKKLEPVRKPRSPHILQPAIPRETVLPGIAHIMPPLAAVGFKRAQNRQPRHRERKPDFRRGLRTQRPHNTVQCQRLLDRDVRVQRLLQPPSVAVFSRLKHFAQKRGKIVWGGIHDFQKR